ncbi:MAG: GerMN domain-containing protein [Candidatus Krumholzibacteria bacterium]|nr:GerMN domain-containing protein [Candidatus Krumholzibacteria bacterium]
MRETSIGRKILIVLLAFAVVAAGLAVYMSTRPKEGEPPAGVESVPEGTRSVTLYFASRQADGLLSETREVAVGDEIESQVRAVLTALFEGPAGDGMVSAIPKWTEVLQVFWVEDTQILYVDFNGMIVSNHPGGSAGEYYTIATIVKTIASNFPQVRRVQFLVEGYPVETLAGHYDVQKPLDIMNWK